MNNIYYSISVISIISMVILCFCAINNMMLNKKKKFLFCVLFATVTVLNISKSVSDMIMGIDGQFIGLHTALKVTELTLTPFLCLLTSLILSNDYKRGNMVGVIMLIHTLFQIVAAFFGWTFTVDEHNTVHQEAFYFTYYLSWIAVIVLFCIEAYKIICRHHYKGKMIFFFLILCTVAEILIVLITGDRSKVMLTTTLIVTFFYQIYCEMMQQVDGLTMLLNRQAYENSIATLNGNAAIMIFDVDNFKEINDTFGHQFGDMCLKSIAEHIIDIYGPYGKCFRIGGDEFAAIINKNIDSINKMNTKLFAEIEKEIYVKRHFPSVSVGFSKLNSKEESVVDVIKKADEEMYNSKKNRVLKRHTQANEAAANALEKIQQKTFEELEVKTTKRKVLVVEDNEINRDILVDMLEDDYDVICAENGEIGLQKMLEFEKELSVVILDVYMPICDGFEFLKRVKNDLLLSKIPVVVSTASNKVDDEIKCVELGAVEFVTKPYTEEIIKGRIKNIIKLKESVSVLNEVEHDTLTNMYTLSAFEHYVDDTIANYPNAKYDLLCMEICEFDIYNNVFGTDVGDKILKYIAGTFCKAFDGNINAIQGNKLFTFGAEISDSMEESVELLIETMKELLTEKGLRIQFGAYKNVDKGKPTKTILNCVMLALENADRSSENVCYYQKNDFDEFIHSRKMFRNIVESLRNDECLVYFQPKVSVDSQEIIGAEALVRWVDSDGKIISPGEYIPLFEREAMIDMIDEYILRKTCEYLKNKMDNGERIVPVSVNLSRISLRKANIVEKYRSIVNESGVPFSMIMFEITETTVADEVIKEHLDLFEKEGFLISLDDFGVGYSSLECLNEHKYKELKLDKSLVDDIGNDTGKLIIKNVVALAHDLGISVVAEGVEKIEQLKFLKHVRCNGIQGFIYSKPVNSSDFDSMLINGIPKISC